MMQYEKNLLDLKNMYIAKTAACGFEMDPMFQLDFGPNADTRYGYNDDKMLKPSFKRKSLPNSGGRMSFARTLI